MIGSSGRGNAGGVGGGMSRNRLRKFMVIAVVGLLLFGYYLLFTYKINQSQRNDNDHKSGLYKSHSSNNNKDTHHNNNRKNQHDDDDNGINKLYDNLNNIFTPINNNNNNNNNNDNNNNNQNNNNIKEDIVIDGLIEKDSLLVNRELCTINRTFPITMYYYQQYKDEFKSMKGILPILHSGYLERPVDSISLYYDGIGGVTTSNLHGEEEEEEEINNINIQDSDSMVTIMYSVDSSNSNSNNNNNGLSNHIETMVIYYNPNRSIQSLFNTIQRIMDIASCSIVILGDINNYDMFQKDIDIILTVNRNLVVLSHPYYINKNLLLHKTYNNNNNQKNGNTRNVVFMELAIISGRLQGTKQESSNQFNKVLTMNQFKTNNDVLSLSSNSDNHVCSNPDNLFIIGYQPHQQPNRNIQMVKYINSYMVQKLISFALDRMFTVDRTNNGWIPNEQLLSQSRCGTEYVTSIQTYDNTLYTNEIQENDRTQSSIKIIEFLEDSNAMPMDKIYKLFNSIDAKFTIDSIERDALILNWIFRPNFQFREKLIEKRIKLFKDEWTQPRCLTIIDSEYNNDNQNRASIISTINDNSLFKQINTKAPDSKSSVVLFVISDGDGKGTKNNQNNIGNNYKQSLSSFSKIDLTLGSLELDQVTNSMDFYSDLMVMSQCPYVIGNLNSDIGKVVMSFALTSVNDYKINLIDIQQQQQQQIIDKNNNNNNNKDTTKNIDNNHNNHDHNANPSGDCSDEEYCPAIYKK